MKTHSSQPITPLELANFPFFQKITYNTLIWFFKTTGLWEYPQHFSGDLETMKFWDRVYWLYKNVVPIKKARKGSQLEAYFKKQQEKKWQLPTNFQANNELTISSVGDLINNRFLTNSKDILYENIAELIFGADVSTANLECVIYPEAKHVFLRGFDWNDPPKLQYDYEKFSVVRGHKGRNYTFMSAACNHTLDFGTEGAESTARILTTDGIAFNGINVNDEQADQGTIVEKKGIKLGMISYTFGLNGFLPPKERPLIVNRLKLNDKVEENDFTRLKNQIKYCQNQGASFIVLHLHWGLESEFYPIPEQVEIAHHLAELGADLIVGHHPHVIQPIEFYTTARDPDRIVPIYYSLGNLVNFFTASHLCKSGIALVTLSQGVKNTGEHKVYVKEATMREVTQKVDDQRQVVSVFP